MKLTRLRPDKVQSDKGFVVWMKNPFQIHYSKGDHSLVVAGEMLTGEADLLVSISPVKTWKAPFNSELIDHAKKDEIMANIRAALEFLGVRVESD